MKYVLLILIGIYLIVGSVIAEGIQNASTAIRPFSVHIPEDQRDLAPGGHHGLSWGDLSIPRDMGPACISQPDLFHEVDKGGHYAAWEEPELYSAELQAAFRSLR